MWESLFFISGPMALGAQIILGLVLLKGEICPGQRGRIHKVLPVIALLWLLATLNSFWFVLQAVMIGVFYSQVKISKTREEGPIWLLFLAAFGGFITLCFTGLAGRSWLGFALISVQIILTGALLAHGLLIVARTRLQAFHRLLPLTGIASAMLLSVLLLPYANQLSSEQLALVTPTILLSFMLLVVAVIVWCWHLLVRQSVVTRQLGIALVLLIGSVSGFYSIFTIQPI
jgi:hypothetical protein